MGLVPILFSGLLTIVLIFYIIFIMYIIIKYILNQKTGKKLPVILLNSQSEVLEFDNEEDAISYKDLFQQNSDSNHEYVVKKV